LQPLFFVCRQQYAERVITDLVEIRRLGAAKEPENRDFRRYLSAHHHRIEPFQILAAEIQQQIDCTACANCCRCSTVTVNHRDIETIARHLGYEPEHIVRQYTGADPGSFTTRTLKSTPQGCIFLDGNLCTIYDARPQACRDFPHVSLSTRSLGARFSSLCRWGSSCPIIYNALESYKHLVGYRASARAA
jgi:Fe-S-cluster containining protein